MLTAQSCALHGSGGSAEAPSPGGAQRMVAMGCTAFQGRSAQGLEGHFTISPIPAGSGWHHPQLSEPCQCWRATDAGSAALNLLRGKVSRLRQQSQKNPSDSRSAWQKPCPWEGNSGKRTPQQTLSPAPNSWDKTPCLLPSRAGKVAPRQAQPETGRGEMGWDGKGGHDQPWLQHLQEHGPFYSSLHWPLHVQPCVSHVITKAILTGRIIFIFLIQQPANSLWLGDAKNGSHFLHLAK